MTNTSHLRQYRSDDGFPYRASEGYGYPFNRDDLPLFLEPTRHAGDAKTLPDPAEPRWLVVQTVRQTCASVVGRVVPWLQGLASGNSNDDRPPALRAVPVAGVVRTPFETALTVVAMAGLAGLIGVFSPQDWPRARRPQTLQVLLNSPLDFGAGLRDRLLPAETAMPPQALIAPLAVARPAVEERPRATAVVPPAGVVIEHAAGEARIADHRSSGGKAVAASSDARDDTSNPFENFLTLGIGAAAPAETVVAKRAGMLPLPRIERAPWRKSMARRVLTSFKPVPPYIAVAASVAKNSGPPPPAIPLPSFLLPPNPAPKVPGAPAPLISHFKAYDAVGSMHDVFKNEYAAPP